MSNRAAESVTRGMVSNNERKGQGIKQGLLCLGQKEQQLKS